MLESESQTCLFVSKCPRKEICSLTILNILKYKKYVIYANLAEYDMRLSYLSDVITHVRVSTNFTQYAKYTSKTKHACKLTSKLNLTKFTCVVIFDLILNETKCLTKHNYIKRLITLPKLTNLCIIRS